MRSDSDSAKSMLNREDKSVLIYGAGWNCCACCETWSFCRDLTRLCWMQGTMAWFSCTKEETASNRKASTLFYTRRYNNFWTSRDKLIGVGTGIRFRLVRVEQAMVSWLACFIIWTSAFGSWTQGLVCTWSLPIFISAAQTQ